MRFNHVNQECSLKPVPSAQTATGGRALQRVVPPVHDVPLEELTRKLRAVWASCGGTPDLGAVKQVCLARLGRCLIKLTARHPWCFVARVRGLTLSARWLEEIGCAYINCQFQIWW